MSPPNHHEAWFTTQTLAEKLGVSERLIRKWKKEGRIASYKIDGCRRFDPADVDRFLADFKEEGALSS
jgi:excisionase family DNA binding protein